MSDQETIPNGTAMAEILVEPRLLEKTITYQGQIVTIRHYPLTRFMRNKAIMEAVDSYLREHPDSRDNKSGLGGDPTVAERELAVRMIKWWSLPKPPKLAWEWLPIELGDAIVKILGIDDIFVLKLKDGKNSENSAAVENAKNL